MCNFQKIQVFFFWFFLNSMEMYCTEDVGNPASNSLETTIVAVWELV